MGKKGNDLNPYEVTGPFRILLKGGQLLGGEIKGAWDNAFMVEDPKNGSTIIFIDSIAAMMEGLNPPEPGEKKEAENEISLSET